jgi:hypothetical protein
VIVFALREKPPSHEPQDLEGGAVEPLSVLHDAEEGLLFGDLGQERQCSESDEETVRCGPGREAERDAQRVSLWRWKPVEAVQHRRTELMEPRERQLHLGLDPGDLGHTEALGPLRKAVQQCGLSDSGLAAHD